MNNSGSFIEFANNRVKFDKTTSLVTSIDQKENERLVKIYSTSHWVTFIDPKVDLNFFKNNEKSSDLLIIHYSDQYSTASGYDAITVTKRSKQYMDVLLDYLKRQTTDWEKYNLIEIINTFNVFNGEWLLKLISRHFLNDRDSYSMEKLSLISAIKCFKSFTQNSDIIWIPISLEELLRVSGGVGLSKGESIFNPQYLGESGQFSDDLLMVGIKIDQEIDMYLYPIEVKIGNNDLGVMNKAEEQVLKTHKLFNASKISDNSIEGKIYRNILAQLTIIQAKKIMLYNLWPEKKWEKIIENDVVKKLLNDNFTLKSFDSDQVGSCGIVSFSRSSYSRSISLKTIENTPVSTFKLPIEDGMSYLYRSLDEIAIINNWKHSFSYSSENVETNSCENVSDENKESSYESAVCEIDELKDGIVLFDEIAREDESDEKDIFVMETPKDLASIGKNNEGMRVVFGYDEVSKNEAVWLPNATDHVMHINTGIIGTMGTGKTQFTKSMIAQLKREEDNNIDGLPIGILIFDYKGDYIKDDFIEATDAKRLDLYKLPYNPLSLFLSKNPKPLLPVHTASELRDTIVKAYNLGNVQSNLLKQLILDAYDLKGIVKNDATTWSKTPPTINTVLDLYFAREEIKEDSLYSVFSELKDYELFEPDPLNNKNLFDLMNGVTVLNLSGYPESIQNLVVAITLDTFYSQMQSQGHSKQVGAFRQLNKMILVDEADNFLSKNFNSIKKILKEGREFGVGVILSTQFLKHFSTGENEYAQYVLTWVIHKVSDITRNEVGNIFNIQNKTDQESLMNEIKNLKKHYSFVNLGGDNKPRYIKDKAFWELSSDYQSLK